MKERGRKGRREERRDSQNRMVQFDLVGQYEGEVDE